MARGEGWPGECRVTLTLDCAVRNASSILALYTLLEGERDDLCGNVLDSLPGKLIFWIESALDHPSLDIGGVEEIALKLCRNVLLDARPRQ